ncbi:UDP-glucose--hexose-1-phosphate uridylyltransferase [Paenibacillus sp. JCM 10914]|uniref:UDP-glucose--hexose-1-phosphate uridylyltransferase n=1 Tax=Paenibacillus sp. JCM 10914 TaxID=1236974 RepID=UPI0003CCA35A|nr:UDP-glucose--hexose-1-phosphate uridylyltransferase [Paenibacillus sp. JCM 10914]GAE04049.1 galactose-1-phosphate uridylyltransferase [Paenibacillus sp. JCM 10914]
MIYAPSDTPDSKQVLLAIELLVKFAHVKGMIHEADIDYSRNLLLEDFGFSEPYLEEIVTDIPDEAQPMLDVLIDYAAAQGFITENTDTYRDLLDAKIMGRLMARPSEVTAEFVRIQQEHGIEVATTKFYQLCVDSNYIRMDRVAKNEYWQHSSPYGDIEITINLSKPEKNPKEIAMAKLLPPPVYPKCQLCRENVGYAGRINHPARQNLRIIPLDLNGEPWYFQYSPYVYYNEHCIVFHRDHVPMKLTRETLNRLLGFVDAYPHYFLGSNADLPIVGGSILTHDHFQGGRHTFPIQKAPKIKKFGHAQYPGVSASIVKWPMSVIRLSAANREILLECASSIYESWKSYSDPSVDIEAYSEVDGEQVRHNTVTPIARRDEAGGYELDLVLRNNRTNAEHPEGIFHPHREMFHIKKENIGLIEVMGLAILPGRLKAELDQIADILAGDQALLAASDDPGHALAVHKEWIEELRSRGSEAKSKSEAVDMIREEVGHKFTTILEHAGVFKQSFVGQEAFERFLHQIGFRTERD